MTLTPKLQAALWRAYGDPAKPAEWDGHVYGGGKLSQRFWEYHQSIELLELTADSVVLDIGGGSPVTGAGFFTQVIAPHVKEVHVLDVNVGQAGEQEGNIRFHRMLGSYETMSQLLTRNAHITHIASVSVFEHIPHDIRCGMMRALNEHFHGDIFAGTVEFHTRDRLFEHQLTTRTLSETFAPLTEFYPDRLVKSPVWAENAYSKSRSLGGRIVRRLKTLPEWEQRDPLVPLWYPLAFRFRKNPAGL